jgi:hypothetical protein
MVDSYDHFRGTSASPTGYKNRPRKTVLMATVQSSPPPYVHTILTYFTQVQNMKMQAAGSFKTLVLNADEYP